MARDSRQARQMRAVHEVKDVVSVLAPGLRVLGDIKSDGTVRVEGEVQGSINASKSVVVGQGGTITGDIETQDVVVAGRVEGTIQAASRVELQSTCHVEGDIRSRRIKLDEGGQIDGRLFMSKDATAEGAVPGGGAPAASGPRRAANTA